MEEAICTLSFRMCAKVIIHPLLGVKVIIHTSLFMKVIIYTLAMCAKLIIHTSRLNYLFIQFLIKQICLYCLKSAVQLL